MEFVNATPASAAFLNTTFGENHMLAAVIARLAFRVDDGQLVPTPEFQWPVGRLPAETPYGVCSGRRAVPDRRHRRLRHRQPVAARRAAGYGADRGNPDWRAVPAARHGNRRPPVDPPKRLACARNAGAVCVDAAILRPGVRGCRGNRERPVCRGRRIRPARGSILRPSRPMGSRCRTSKTPEHRIVSIEDRPEPMATGPYPARGIAAGRERRGTGPRVRESGAETHPASDVQPRASTDDSGARRTRRGTASLWRSRTRVPRARCDSRCPSSRSTRGWISKAGITPSRCTWIRSWCCSKSGVWFSGIVWCSSTGS